MRSLSLAALLILIIFLSLTSTTVTQDYKIMILSHRSYLKGANEKVVIAEAENIGSKILTSVNITATFYDNSNEVIGSAWNYTMIRDLLPGQKSPVKIVFERGMEVYNYTLAVDGVVETEAYTYRDFNFTSDYLYNEYLCYAGMYCVYGIVQNIGDFTANSVKLIVTHYNRDNNIVQAAYGYTIPKDLEPGQIAEYWIEILELADIVSIYSVFVEAETTSPPPTPSPTIGPTLSPTPIITPTPSPSTIPTNTSTPITSPSPTSVPTLSPKPTALLEPIPIILIVLFIVTVVTIGSSLYRRRKTKS